MRFVSPLFFAFLYVVFFSNTSLAQDGIAGGDNVVPFASDLRPVTWGSRFLGEAFDLEIKFASIYPAAVGVEWVDLTLDFRSGVGIVDSKGKLKGYAVQGGMFQSTLWRIVIDPQVTPAERRRIVEIIAGYATPELTGAEAVWKKDAQYTRIATWENPEIKIDFSDANEGSRQWIGDLFGKYENAILFDRAHNQAYWPGLILPAPGAVVEELPREDAKILPFAKPRPRSHAPILKCFDAFRLKSPYY